MTIKYVTVDKAGHKLAPESAASYKRALLAGLPEGGVQVFVRTWDEQDALYKRYKAGRGPIAAKPSWSAPHIAGLAMDFITTGANETYAPSDAFKWAILGTDGSKTPRQLGSDKYFRLNDFGWYRSVPSERWHLQYYASKDLARALKKGTKAKYATKIVQKKLGLTDDGVFGSLTEAAVKKFQKENGLTDDGVVGTNTWAALATPKPPTTTTPPPTNNEPVVKIRNFNFVSANLQAERWKGLDDASTKRGEYLKSKASVFALYETNEIARTAIIKELGADKFKVYPIGYVCVMWDSTKWDHGEAKRISFGTNYHGAIRVPLTDKTTGIKINFIAMHVKPAASYPGKSDAYIKEQKLKEILKAMNALYEPNVITVIAGDFNTASMANSITPFGATRLTDSSVTTTDDGKILDAVFSSGNIQVLDIIQLDPGRISDHLLWQLKFRVSTKQINTT